MKIKFPLCNFLLFGKQIDLYHINKYNHLIQIEHLIPIYDYDKKKDVFCYNTKLRRNFKNTFFKEGLVENHHIIPKQFKKHELIKKINFDIGRSQNIIFLPNISAQSILNDETQIYHQSHIKYNKYIKQQLDDINKNVTMDEKKYEFWLFFYSLYNGLKDNDEFIKSLIHN